VPRRPGAAGDLNKRADSAQLIDAIRRAAHGQLGVNTRPTNERAFGFALVAGVQRGLLDRG